MSTVGEDRKRPLGEMELLDGLCEGALESLAEEVRWVEAPAGSEVIAEGARRAATALEEIGVGRVAEQARDLLGSV